MSLNDYSVHSQYSGELAKAFIYLAGTDGQVIGMGRLSKPCLEEVAASSNKRHDNNDLVNKTASCTYLFQNRKEQVYLDEALDSATEYFFTTKSGGMCIEKISATSETLHAVVIMHYLTDEQAVLRPFAFFGEGEEPVSPSFIEEAVKQVVAADKVKHPDWFKPKS